MRCRGSVRSGWLFRKSYSRDEAVPRQPGLQATLHQGYVTLAKAPSASEWLTLLNVPELRLPSSSTPLSSLFESVSGTANRSRTLEADEPYNFGVKRGCACAECMMTPSLVCSQTSSHGRVKMVGGRRRSFQMVCFVGAPVRRALGHLRLP